MTAHPDTTSTHSRFKAALRKRSMASTPEHDPESSTHSGTEELEFTESGLNALGLVAASPRSGWGRRVALGVILPVVVTVFAHCAERCGAGKWHVEFKGASGSVTLYGSPRSPSPTMAGPWANDWTASTTHSKP